MSSNFSYSSSSYSSSTTSSDGQRTGQAYSSTTRSDPSGTTVKTQSQNLGGPIVEETRYLDREGRPVQGIEGSSSDKARIEDVTDVTDEEQKERDRQYEERMEDEYAKREGGA